MKIVISNIEQFGNFFDVIYAESSETIELRFFMDKLTCAILNKAHTRFFYAEFESKFFDEYDVDKPQSYMVSADEFYKLTNRVANKRTDVLSIEFKDDVILCELENNGNKRIFEFPYPYDEVSSPNFPQVALPVTFDLEMSDIINSIKDIEFFGNHIFQFVVSDSTITLMSDNSVETYETSSVKYASVIEADVDYDGVLSVRFPFTAIKQMSEFKKIAKEIEIELGEKALIYKVEDEFMGVTVRGMIAPLVEEE